MCTALRSNIYIKITKQFKIWNIKKMNNITSEFIKTRDENKENTQTDEFRFSEEPSLERLRSIQTQFVNERNWQQFQTPRNILLALVGEVGELAEIFQWKGLYSLARYFKILLINFDY